jgi:hypothetical protein
MRGKGWSRLLRGATIKLQLPNYNFIFTPNFAYGIEAV